MKNKIYFILLGLFFATMIWVSATVFNGPSVAYINNQELLEEFQGSKELKLRIQKMQMTFKSEMDSLAFEIRNLRAISNLTEEQKQSIRLKEESYANRNAELNQKLQQQSQEMSSAMMAQVNNAMEEFGKENGYDILLGAAGNGSLMYASDKLDKTPEAIDYLNEYYEGL